MAIKPNDNVTIGARFTAADSNYTYGSSKNETTPGAGDGTPYFKGRADDIFGMQQSLLDEASIVPSGNAETVPISQYKEAIRTIMNMRTTTHDMASDANYTLTDDQNRKRRVIITDTGVVLTTGRNIVVDDMEKRFIFSNETAQTLTVIISGASIGVAAGATVDLYNDGTDILESADNPALEIASTAEAQAGTNNAKAISPLRLHEAMLGGVSQSLQDVTGSRSEGVVYTNTTGRPITIMIQGTIDAGSGAGFQVEIDGSVVYNEAQNITSTHRHTAALIVQDDSTYEVPTSAVYAINAWFEIR